MKVLVAGAGAIGSAFGGFLRLAGHEVTLVGRRPHMEAVRERGLRITGIWGEHVARGFSVFTEFGAVSGEYDAVLVCVKSHDTAAVAGELGRLIGRDGIVVSLQNGIGNAEVLATRLGSAAIAAGRVIFGVAAREPGSIEITVYTAPVMIGAARAETTPRAVLAHARAFAGAVRAAGIPCRYTRRIESYLWAKLLYNCALNPLSAIHGVHYGALAERPEWRGIMDEIITEAFRVARAMNVRMFWKSSRSFLRVFYGKLVPDTRHHRSSMLQDVERGRRTEIESMCGMVVKYGRILGVPTPRNSEMLETVLTLSASRSGGSEGRQDVR